LLSFIAVYELRLACWTTCKPIRFIPIRFLSSFCTVPFLTAEEKQAAKVAPYHGTLLRFHSQIGILAGLRA
jgi:hypothetical protein